MQHFVFGFFGVLFEAVGDEESGGTNDGAKSDERVTFHGMPDDAGEDYGDDGVKPDALFHEEAFVMQTKFFFFEE